jgi:2-haloacid dehalogenase
LTFDCYGTLIDWESGILRALRPIVAAHRQQVPSDDDLLGLYAAIEREVESGPYRTYREVLQQVVRNVGARLSFTPTSIEALLLAESVKDWLPFPDTVDALRRLASRYRLVILSNVDDDLFAATARRLQTKFADVITAQQARSYKPSLNNFRLAFQRIGVPAAQVLHVAESLYHDIAPARQLGLANVWVNRRAGRKASASGTAAVTPDLEVPDLKTLADLMGV